MRRHHISYPRFGARRLLGLRDEIGRGENSADTYARLTALRAADLVGGYASPDTHFKPLDVVNTRTLYDRTER